jgi:3-deoxy-D-manno-octulosonate 8-phosphate phosphatase KdsC-like HAD superfamily phosphatase
MGLDEERKVKSHGDSGWRAASQVTVEQAEILGDDNNDLRMLEDVRAELVAAGYMRASAAQALVDAKRSGGGKKGKGSNAKNNKGKGKQVRRP